MEKEFKPFTFSIEVTSIKQLKSLWLLSNACDIKMLPILENLSKRASIFIGDELDQPVKYHEWMILDDKIEELGL